MQYPSPAPSIPQTLGDIYVNVLHLVGVPFLFFALALSFFAWLWRRRQRSAMQRRAIAFAFLLWGIGPLAALIGAAFHFHGADIGQFNHPAMRAVVLLDWTNTIGAIAAFVYGKGVRLNIVAACLPALLLNSAVTYFVACELVWICT